MNEARITQIRERLTSALAPSQLDIIDESHKHRGHPGAKDGRGHFAVTICATSLETLSRIQQHQAIYKALGSLMQTDIHALSIHIMPPSA